MNRKQINVQNWLNTFCRAMATQLNSKINPLPTRVKKFGVLAVGIVLGMICVWLVFQPMKMTETQSLPIDSITVPRVLENEESSEQLLMDHYNQMIFYKEFFDNLQSNPNRLQILDSLAKARPGLEDSVKTFLKNYYSH